MGDKRRVLRSEGGLFSWRVEASSGTIGLCGHRANATRGPASVSCLGRRELIPMATFHLKT